MNIRVRTRGRLPHWLRADAGYFVTFRTASSISPETLAALRLSPYTPDEKRKQIEEALDRCDRGAILGGATAETVAASVLYGHERDYHLSAWCVMPNHVHLLFRLVERKRLSIVMQALKSATAHKINKILGQSGQVWEREYFDRLVRPGKLEAVRNYILRNPESAKFVNWRWVGSLED